jgi:large subunit ribosomal protein L6
MSRVGRQPIKIPEKVKVSVDGSTVKVEGPKGKMTFPTNPLVKIEVDKGEIRVLRPDESKLAKGLHGLTRTIVRNAVDGVVKGYERVLEISGVGFKADVKGKDINFTLGFSHPVVFKIPEGVTAEVDAKQTRLTIRGVDKHQLGLTAAKIRALRPPEPYKGKGIKYAEETIRRKEGKTGAA